MSEALYDGPLEAHVETYVRNYPQCPLLQKCHEFSGIDCTDRAYGECDLFRDVITYKRTLRNRQKKET